MTKYPAEFKDATHGLVLGTYKGDGFLFEGLCRISRQTDKLVTIESPTGATFTFNKSKYRGKETGKIKNFKFHGYTNGGSWREICSPFKVVPYLRKKDNA